MAYYNNKLLCIKHVHIQWDDDFLANCGVAFSTKTVYCRPVLSVLSFLVAMLVSLSMEQDTNDFDVCFLIVVTIVLPFIMAMLEHQMTS